MSGKHFRSQQFEQRKQHHGLPFTVILIEWAQPITPLGALGVLAVQPAAESRP
jgi:hypothetical protein